MADTYPLWLLRNSVMPATVKILILSVISVSYGIRAHRYHYEMVATAVTSHFLNPCKIVPSLCI